MTAQCNCKCCQIWQAELRIAKEAMKSLFKQKGDLLDENEKLKDQLAGARGIHKQMKEKIERIKEGKS